MVVSVVHVVSWVLSSVGESHAKSRTTDRDSEMRSWDCSVSVRNAVVSLRRAAAQAEVQPVVGDDPRRRDMDEGTAKPDCMLFRQIYEHSVPGVCDAVQVKSEVQSGRVSGKAAGAWPWQEMSPRESGDFV